MEWDRIGVGCRGIIVKMPGIVGCRLLEFAD